MYNLKFPREISIPKRILVSSKKEYLEILNKNSKFNNLYTNVYNFDEVINNRLNYNTAIIDRLFFDFDKEVKHSFEDVEKRPENGYYDFKKVFTWCVKKNIKCYPYLSGGGYHLYTQVKCNDIIKDKKMLIYNAQKFIINEVNKEIKNGEVEVITDSKTMGKTDQIARIPFTYNFGKRSFCIPLFEDIVYLGDKIIKEKGKDINYVKSIMKKKFIGYGELVLDIKEFNVGRNMFMDNVYTPIDVEVNIEHINDKIKGELPKCLQWMFLQKFLGWDLRRILIVWLRDNGYLKEEAKEILKQQLNKKRKHGRCVETDYEHMRKENQIDYIYKREDLFFPTHRNLIIKGVCPYKNKNECKLKDKGCNMYGRF